MVSPSLGKYKKSFEFEYLYNENIFEYRGLIISYHPKQLTPSILIVLPLFDIFLNPLNSKILFHCKETAIRSFR